MCAWFTKDEKLLLLPCEVPLNFLVNLKQSSHVEDTQLFIYLITNSHMSLGH